MHNHSLFIIFKLLNDYNGETAIQNA